MYKTCECPPSVMRRNVANSCKGSSNGAKNRTNTAASFDLRRRISNCRQLDRKSTVVALEESPSSGQRLHALHEVSHAPCKGHSVVARQHAMRKVTSFPRMPLVAVGSQLWVRVLVLCLSSFPQRSTVGLSRL